jgi:hypothetical protein
LLIGEAADTVPVLVDVVVHVVRASFDVEGALRARP